jgi:hypothetical protein
MREVVTGRIGNVSSWAASQIGEPCIASKTPVLVRGGILLERDQNHLPGDRPSHTNGGRHSRSFKSRVRRSIEELAVFYRGRTEVDSLERIEGRFKLSGGLPHLPQLSSTDGSNNSLISTSLASIIFSCCCPEVLRVNILFFNRIVSTRQNLNPFLN